VKLSIDLKAERGSAIVDLIGFGLILQIPILMFATATLQLQHQSFALEAIARHALRAHVLWPDWSNTAQVVDDLAKDFNIELKDISWQLSCQPDPNCQISGSVARLEVSLGELVAYSIQVL
jgi:hypothetical protein